MRWRQSSFPGPYGCHSEPGQPRTTNGYVDNVSGFLGGAVRLYETGSLTVTNSLFTNNTASGGDGGAIDIENGDVTVSNTTFGGNTASFGGAVHSGSSGSLTIIRSTFSGNSSTTALGSAIEVGGTGITTIIDSTLSGNSGSFNSAAGMTQFTSPTIKVINSTVTNNVGFGLQAGPNSTGTFQLINTIVADQDSTTGQGDCNGVAARFELLATTLTVMTPASSRSRPTSRPDIRSPAARRQRRLHSDSLPAPDQRRDQQRRLDNLQYGSLQQWLRTERPAWRRLYRIVGLLRHWGLRSAGRRG